MGFPNYKVNNLTGLVRSLVRQLNHQPAQGEFKDIFSGNSPPRNTLLFLIDGLGFKYLQAQDDCFLKNHCLRPLESVFPSTTASAISTVMTALAPAGHGVTGWHMYIQAFGMVIDSLPYQCRLTKTPVPVDIHWLLDQPPFTQALAVESHYLLPAYLCDSPYSVATAANAKRIPYENLDQLHERLIKLCGQGGEKYIYAYWPDFDATAHQFGVGSEQSLEKFNTINRLLERLAADLEGSDCRLLVTADHGFVDNNRIVCVNDHPALAECLALPLCGEPRAAYAYVRKNKAAQFEKYVSEQLADDCDLYTSAELIERGVFGDGPHHPQLGARTGDYTLVMKSSTVIYQRLAGEHEFSMIGVHGGISDSERLIPLICAEC